MRFEGARTKNVIEETFVQDLQAGRPVGTPAVDLQTYAGLLQVVRLEFAAGWPRRFVGGNVLRAALRCFAAVG